MRISERDKVRKARAAARRVESKDAAYTRVTMDKEHSVRISRAFYDGLKDKENFEFVCAS
ncbi:hypothetical protein ACI2JR_25810 [Klebsiella sp. NPDC088457]